MRQTDKKNELSRPEGDRKEMVECGQKQYLYDVTIRIVGRRRYEKSYCVEVQDIRMADISSNRAWRGEGEKGDEI